MDDLSDEPVFQESKKTSGEEPDGIWAEPALADALAAESARKEHRLWLASQWCAAHRGTRILVFASLCVFSGVAAILCTFAKGSIGLGVWAMIIGAPVVEEMAKAIVPLAVLEKRPWLFGSASSIVLVGVVSGLVFASVENLLYFFVYIPEEELTEGLCIWRLTACTALHVTGASLSCTGLARAWRRAADAKSGFEMSTAMPWLVASVFLHALYNTGALVFGLWKMLVVDCQ